LAPPVAIGAAGAPWLVGPGESVSLRVSSTSGRLAHRGTGATIGFMRAPESTLSFLRAGAAALVMALAALSPAADTGGTASWPRWRGPLGNGVSPDGDPPLRWSEQENVRFKVSID